MTQNEEFTNAGYAVIDTETSENKLLNFLKENYPTVIRDNELKLDELKAILGLPVDEKVNGYGLNFVGRNVARAKYAQKSEKELHLNTVLSKDIDTTQNLVLKGDNLDSLKILKTHYSGKIKCIYIDPPYNTTSDEFVYPDKFDKEEAEVLGLANLSESDFARMDFSFKTKKSHNGWLSFIYPRLLLARDLLSNDGVIFISIDDNEQANMKLLCDEIFGEENFIGQIIWRGGKRNLAKYISVSHEYILFYAKNLNSIDKNNIIWRESKIGLDEIYKQAQLLLVKNKNNFLQASAELKKWFKNAPEECKQHEHYCNIDSTGVYCMDNVSRVGGGKYSVINPINNKEILPPSRGWTFGKEEDFWTAYNKGIIEFRNDDKLPVFKRYLKDNEFQLFESVFYKDRRASSIKIKELFNGNEVFDFPKDEGVIKKLFQVFVSSDSLILDFFAGSGTTGHAVMQLNTEDGGNRKYILCQIDEPIKEDKPAYKFCIDNNLPPVISSITIERLRRAGEKIAASLNPSAVDTSQNLFSEEILPSGVRGLDIGFKVFDSVEAPRLAVEGEQIVMKYENNDTLSRIYNMIFSIGVDEPTQTPETVVEGCVYKIGTNYYITNSEKVNSDDFSNAIKNASTGSATGKVFIDGWTASLNGTLQHYKEDVKIVF
ncbi:MAG: site-specific DNA-methyltransferase [Paludibacter sp.]